MQSANKWWLKIVETHKDVFKTGDEREPSVSSVPFCILPGDQRGFAKTLIHPNMDLVERLNLIKGGLSQREHLCCQIKGCQSIRGERRSVAPPTIG